MQPNRFVTAETWLGNARIDLEVAAEISERYPSRACFHAQQGAEMALKALLIALTDDHPRSHIGDVLVQELRALSVNVPAAVETAANRLDLFYMGSRYPDALGGADPSKVLQVGDAVSAIRQGSDVLAFVEESVERLSAEARRA